MGPLRAFLLPFAAALLTLVGGQQALLLSQPEPEPQYDRPLNVPVA